MPHAGDGFFFFLSSSLDTCRHHHSGLPCLDSDIGVGGLTTKMMLSLAVERFVLPTDSRLNPEEECPVLLLLGQTRPTHVHSSFSRLAIL